MSTGTPLSVTPQTARYELAGVTLDRRTDRSTSRRGVAGICGLVLSTCGVALAAPHTTALLPVERFVLGGLAGAFNGLNLDIHSGGAIAALVVFFASYAVVVGSAARLSARMVLMTIAAVYALVLLAPPLFSTDVFSYQAYARMGALYGINPYTHGPWAISFDTTIFPYIGAKWSYIPSAYGPVFTVASYLMAPLAVATSVFAYKALAAVSGIVLVVLVWHCARLRGKNPVTAAALVGLNPLVVLYGVGGGHNDLLMLAFLVGGLYAVLASRERLGGALTMVATGIKLTAGIVLPFALVAGGPRHRRGRRDLVLGAGVALATVAAFSLVVFGAGSIDMLKTINHSQSEGGWQTLPGVISVGLHLPTIAHVLGYTLAAVFIVVTCWLLRRVWRGEMDWIDGAGWATLTMLVASSSLLPWYVGWLLPLAALGHNPRLTRMSLVMTGVVLALQLIGYIPNASGLV